MQPLTIYWSRRDLRITDNPALLAATTYAVETKSKFLPLFILEDYMTSGDPAFQFGYPSRWFLSQALPVFAEQFAEFALVRGKGAQYLIDLSKKYQLSVFVNDDVYSDFYKQISKLKNAGVDIQVLEDALSVPKETRSGEGNLYSVFTPFKKNVWAQFVQTKPQKKWIAHDDLNYLSTAEVNALPSRIENVSEKIMATFSQIRQLKVADTILDLDSLIPRQDLTGWYTSEAEALMRFKDYLNSGDLDGYATNRDSLERDAENTSEKRIAYAGKTSRMSLALAWGLVSARTLLSRSEERRVGKEC